MFAHAFAYSFLYPHAHIHIFILLAFCDAHNCLIHNCLGNPDNLDVNFDFQKTARILVGFLSIETFPSEAEILAYEIKLGFQ